MQTMKITEFQFDKRNARKRTARGRDALELSLRDLGAGRSIVIDKNGQILAGNGVIESAAKAGITEVQVIPSDGTKIVAVQRLDLDLDADDKARKLAVADNRTAEFAEWNPECLSDLASSLDLTPYFSESELNKITAKDNQPEPGEKSGEVDIDSFEFAHRCPKCHFEYND
jgi:hypothetical protein